MRLIDAVALLYEMIGIKDGWLKPPKKVLNLEDLVKSQPTITCNHCPFKEEISIDWPRRSDAPELG